MTEGLAAVTSRIDRLQSLVSGLPGTTTTPMGSAWATTAAGTSAGTSGAGFAASMTGLLSTAGVGSGSETGPGSGAAAAGGGGAGGGGAGGGGAGTLGANAVALARTYAGVAYRWGGTDPASGLDCSGLVQLVYRKLGVKLPRTSQQQQHCGTEISSQARARPGDLVFFGEPAHHVGIYVGDGKMIDAPRAGKTVGVHKLYGTPSHIRRLSPPSTGSSAAGLPSAAGPGDLRGPYAELFTGTGHRHGVDPALLSAVAKAESGYRPKAVSGAGAQGLMQLMPGTARSLGVDPLQPDQAVDGAARLLSGYLKTYSGRVDLALAAYNAGPGAVNRYDGVPPYRETQDYVQRVTSYWKALR